MAFEISYLVRLINFDSSSIPVELQKFSILAQALFLLSWVRLEPYLGSLTGIWGLIIFYLITFRKKDSNARGYNVPACTPHSKKPNQ